MINHPYGRGLLDLPLRAFRELEVGQATILLPRVARAQKIMRLHPALCSASKEGT